MIINLHFNQFTGNLFHFESSMVTLDRNVKYEFGVRFFHLTLTSEPTKKEHDLWSLSSNLVDRSPTNQFRSVSYFILPKTLSQGWEPSSVVFYPLEKHQLENPVFFIERIPRDKQIDTTTFHTLHQVLLSKRDMGNLLMQLIVTG